VTERGQHIPSPLVSWSLESSKRDKKARVDKGNKKDRARNTAEVGNKVSQEGRQSLESDV